MNELGLARVEGYRWVPEEFEARPWEVYQHIGKPSLSWLRGKPYFAKCFNISIFLRYIRNKDVVPPHGLYHFWAVNEFKGESEGDLDKEIITEDWSKYMEPPSRLNGSDVPAQGEKHKGNESCDVEIYYYLRRCAGEERFGVRDSKIWAPKASRLSLLPLRSYW